jgi:hypothetical protein
LRLSGFAQLLQQAFDLPPDALVRVVAQMIESDESPAPFPCQQVLQIRSISIAKKMSDIVDALQIGAAMIVRALTIPVAELDEKVGFFEARRVVALHRCRRGRCRLHRHRRVIGYPSVQQ